MTERCLVYFLTTLWAISYGLYAFIRFEFGRGEKLSGNWNFEVEVFGTREQVFTDLKARYLKLGARRTHVRATFALIAYGD